MRSSGLATTCAVMVCILAVPCLAAPRNEPAKTAQQWLDEGTAAYKAVDLKAAELAFVEAEQALDRTLSDPESRRFAAQVWLNLGRVATVADRPELAKERFREALHLNPVLVVTHETDPPKIVKLLEEVRAEEESLDTESENQPVATGEKAAEALADARAELSAGVSAYEALDLTTAVTRFRAAAKQVATVQPRTQEANALRARIHLYLGRAATVSRRLEDARLEFRKALSADPAVTTDPNTDPPKIVELFNAVRSEPTPVPRPSPSRFGINRMIPFGLGGLVVVLLALRRRSRRRGPSLAGNWNLTTTLVDNNAGTPNGATNTEDVLVRQRGRNLSIHDETGKELFRAVVEGNKIRFAGDVAEGPGAGGRARTYTGDGTASSALIDGNLSMMVAHDVQTNGFQFQSMSKYDYNLHMTRLWGQSAGDGKL